MDFTGTKLKWIDLSSRSRVSELFVAVLPCSQKTCIQATPDQKTESVLHTVQKSLDYFGGVPRALVFDCLKAAVAKACRYEPTISHAMEQLAAHYGTVVLPTRPYRPQDKALVESTIRWLYSRVVRHLEDRQFSSLEALNQRLLELVEVNHNQLTMKHRSYSRQDMFEQIEVPTLKQLPEEPMQRYTQKMLTVGPNIHIFLNEDKHYYSVPYAYLGKKVKVSFSESTIEIYDDHRRIATHRRNKQTFKYTTKAEHMPSQYGIITEWNEDRYTRWASTIGPSTRQMIDAIFSERAHPEQAYKSCFGILTQKKKYGAQRLESACCRAIKYGRVGYRVVIDILERGLDTVDDGDHQKMSGLPQHVNLRGPDYYQ